VCECAHTRVFMCNTGFKLTLKTGKISCLMGVTLCLYWCEDGNMPLLLTSNCIIFYISVPTKQRMKIYRLCPYLDTINRQVLDFDFEKLCSVSLSRINVYACLVCGKYFQGL
jgi:hypothetical protein